MLTRAEVGLSLARSSRSKWDFVLDTLHIFDRLREALYESREVGMILTFSEDSPTCCLPLPVLGSCPYHRLCTSVYVTIKITHLELLVERGDLGPILLVLPLKRALQGAPLPLY